MTAKITQDIIAIKTDIIPDKRRPWNKRTIPKLVEDKISIINKAVVMKNGAETSVISVKPNFIHPFVMAEFIIAGSIVACPHRLDKFSSCGQPNISASVVIR